MGSGETVGYNSFSMECVHRPGEPDPRSILIVLPTWVGDFVMATPSLRSIRERFSGAHITLLMESNLRALVAGGNWMNECVEWPPKSPAEMGASTPFPGLAATPLHKAYREFVRHLRRQRFDWAVLLPNSFRAALVARLAGAKRRFGYDRDGRGFLLTDRLPLRNRRGRAADGRKMHVAVAPRAGFEKTENTPFHPHASVRMGANLPVPVTRFVPMPLVEYYADLAEAIGCQRPGDRLELFTTPDDDALVDDRLASLGVAGRHPLIVISPGARYGAAKCWMPERFAEVCDRLADAFGATIAITCGPGEELIAREIGSAMHRRGHVFADPGLTLGGMKSLIRRADLLISNDAGIRHFAKAFNTPVVTIFGPTHPAWTATNYSLERIVRVDVDCGPCQQRVCPLGHVECMTRVTVDMVYAACQSLLELRVADPLL